MTREPADDLPPAALRLTRHAFVDRLFHWGMALSVLILLGTAFLPILGWEFSWVGIHWATGIVLTGLVVVHGVRASIWKAPRSMGIGSEDVRDGLALLRWSARVSTVAPPRPGKYSLAQKLIHHLFALVVGVAVVTGIMMLVKIDSPWWERDPYWLSEAVWGVVYVLHDLSALFLITMVMLHIYFALRPEKFHFLRSMMLGWITRREFEQFHDPDRWTVDAE